MILITYETTSKSTCSVEVPAGYSTPPPLAAFPPFSGALLPPVFYAPATLALIELISLRV